MTASKKFRAKLTVLLTALSIAGVAHGQNMRDCGSLENAYGPYDYTNPVHVAEKLERVERAHFDAGVENLQGHQTVAGGRAALAGDLGYTLRAFPNHHRALYAMARLHIREGVAAGLMTYSADCWFNRAMRFKADDGNVRMIFGLYLSRVDRYKEALKQYKDAETLMPDSSELAYNTGLLYVDMKNYDLAVEYAHKAYQLGYPLPGLRNKLKRLGEWKTDTGSASVSQ